MNDLLSDEELVELTGYQFPSKQCEALTRAGIFFITRPDGRPRTTWAHINDPLAYRSKPSTAESIEPDFGALG